MHIPDDYVHVDNLVNTVMENQWMTTDEIYNYVRSMIQSELDFTDLMYLEKLRDYLNGIDFMRLCRAKVAEVI